MSFPGKVELSPVQPLPLDIGIPVTPNEKELRERRRFSKLIPFLYTVQKWSILPFGCFALLHIPAVVVMPSISVNLAKQLFTMGRCVYQAPGLESLMVWGSLGVHILSGVTLRLLKIYRNYSYYGMMHKRTRRRKSLFAKDNADDLDPSYGMGGITSLLGLGFKGSYISKILGISPLSFTGYLLLPVLAAHIYDMRLLPASIDGDSNLIDVEYITQALVQHKWTTSLGLLALVGLASYHTIGGMMRYLKLYSLRSRQWSYALVIGMFTVAGFSIRAISQLPLMQGYVGKRYSVYLA
ncbi:BA75_05053T0 [Komagataella pastoris]|uniref:BA75_05053T0 n=1 Tax=Komagataella pastoris TaxID=4922 RepID=A0A1B2JJ93_PICPA|nr:BA75_05053T0 [Komagataella pastoris]